MSSDTVPQGDAIPTVSDKLALAQRYVDVAGWHIFIVRENKRTFPSCLECDAAGPGHDREQCDHLMCHGFYAATRDLNRVRAMFAEYPQGLLAVRTGRISGLIVIDFDTKPTTLKNRITGEEEIVTGLDVHDQWQSYTGGIDLSPTLQAQTRSGGTHLLYKTDALITSRNRILPGTDIKAESGYIVIPPGPGRFWVNRGLPSVAPEALVSFLIEKRGNGFMPRTAVGPNGRTIGGGVAGVSLSEIMRTGCAASGRDEFANTLIFQLRKIDMSYADTVAIMREQWQLMEQPEHDFFHWHYVQYKIDKIWRTVVPDANALPDVARRWVAAAMTQRVQEGEVRKMGNVTVSGRRSWQPGATR